MSGAARRRPIRVLLVDDSTLALEIVRRMLEHEPAISVCGTAHDGAEALALIPRLMPDVVCTDLYMPGMGGLEFTREVMALHPVPILVLSIAVQREHADTIFEMLDAGAVDIVAKPRGGLCEPSAGLAGELASKIKVAAGVVALRRRRHRAVAAEPLPLAAARPGLRPRIVGIAASTGGPQAIETVLHHLPRDFPLPVLCIQHIAEGFMEGLVQWLARSASISVCIGQDGRPPLPATAYFAPDGMHLELDAHGRLRCSPELRGQQHRPSADLALASLARVHGRDAIGVVLTGMGRDGAAGLAEIAAAGGATIAQDEETSVVFGMPGAAIQNGAARLVLPLGQIAPALERLAHGESPAHPTVAKGHAR
ncbi:chemotaxis-specific protein-glutamate methyltransferase CheB [Aromatoleum toluclasticum]|uniref:chemotaxis-specific protein-glutamate methyltransferase CheB n=1 Tax=Aromatoleum toluclasticum TaxID=92003 RepID=UPI001D18694D|nr:chemotaxis-specific protein-glutamate methyltransferase CheB [Aromatoleum toluclasticum]MCC4114214.1 chemotaxis-specific protein-glutamate methyltransferase CheB [Aromatoleum toluclasticum]